MLTDVIVLNEPIPYKHPNGAVTWVTLDEPTTLKVKAEAEQSKNRLIEKHYRKKFV